MIDLHAEHEAIAERFLLYGSRCLARAEGEPDMHQRERLMRRAKMWQQLASQVRDSQRAIAQSYALLSQISQVPIGYEQ